MKMLQCIELFLGRSRSLELSVRYLREEARNMAHPIPFNPCGEGESRGDQDSKVDQGCFIGWSRLESG